jgi:hypothetical protein
MVLGIITAVAACPAIVGTTEAIRYAQRQNVREEHRGRKSNLTITLYRHSNYSPRFDGAKVVLKDSKLYVDVGTGADPSIRALHPFTGYFLPYPDMAEVWKEAGYASGKAEGMVTTVSDDPPFLNWVFVDRNTHELKYGVREVSQPHRVGPWDVTKIDRRVTFEGWEGFIAVEEEDGDDLWALYFDVKDDGLSSDGRIGTKGKRMLEVQVWRQEMRRDRMDAVMERVDRIKAREETESEKSSSQPD